MTGENWAALGGEQIKGNPADFQTLSKYWKDAAQELMQVRKPDLDASGSAAKNFDSAFGEMYAAFKNAREEAEDLGALCADWAAWLDEYQKEASRLARHAGTRQDTIDTCNAKLANPGLKDDDAQSRADRSAIVSKRNVAFGELDAIRKTYSAHLERYNRRVDEFSQRYKSPNFQAINPETNSSSPLGRRIALWIGQIQDEHPEFSDSLNFVNQMLPFEADGKIKDSFFYNDLLFNTIGVFPKLLQDLGLAPKEKSKLAQMLSKNVTYNNISGFVRQKFDIFKGNAQIWAKSIDPSRALKEGVIGALSPEMQKAFERANRRLAGLSEEIAGGMSTSLAAAFKKYSLPVERLQNKISAQISKTKAGDLMEKVGAQSSRLRAEASGVMTKIAEKTSGVRGKAAPALEAVKGATKAAAPWLAKVTRKLPIVGYVVSEKINYDEFYEKEELKSDPADVKFVRAAAASTTTTVAGIGGGIVGGAASGALLGAAIGSIVPGPGTAIGGAIGGIVGGIAGGMAGEQAAKEIHADEFAADRTEEVYNAGKEAVSGAVEMVKGLFGR